MFEFLAYRRDTRYDRLVGEGRISYHTHELLKCIRCGPYTILAPIEIKLMLQ